MSNCVCVRLADTSLYPLTSPSPHCLQERRLHDADIFIRHRQGSREAHDVHFLTLTRFLGNPILR